MSQTVCPKCHKFSSPFPVEMEEHAKAHDQRMADVAEVTRQGYAADVLEFGDEAVAEWTEIAREHLRKIQAEKGCDFWTALKKHLGPTERRMILDAMHPRREDWEEKRFGPQGIKGEAAQIKPGAIAAEVGTSRTWERVDREATEALRWVAQLERVGAEAQAFTPRKPGDPVPVRRERRSGPVRTVQTSEEAAYWEGLFQTT